MPPTFVPAQTQCMESLRNGKECNKLKTRILTVPCDVFRIAFFSTLQ